MLINNLYRLDLRPTTCITPNGAKSISTIIPSVVEKVLRHFCQESAQGPHLVPFLPSFSAFIHDRDTYIDLSHSQKKKILAEMRQSLAEIFLHREIVIGPDVQGVNTDNHDHAMTPRITLKSYLFQALSQAKTEAEVDHVLLMVVIAVIHEISQIWLRVRHPGVIIPETVKARYKSGASSGRGNGEELAEVELFGGLLNLVKMKATIATEEISTCRLSINFPSMFPPSTYIIKDQSARRILSTFLVRDGMLDSPPFFTPMRDIFRPHSGELQDVVEQSTGMARTTCFSGLPTVKQHAPPSRAVPVAENGLVSRHSGLSTWRLFKDVFSDSGLSWYTQSQLQPHNFHTAEASESQSPPNLFRAPAPFPQARLNEFDEIEYPFYKKT